MSPVLSLQAISKSFFGVNVLTNVSLELKAGEVLALMGENGAGKSTLMKIVSGVYANYDGQILIDGQPVRFHNVQDAGRAGIAIIYQELTIVPVLSVAENIFLGREPRKAGILIDYKAMRAEAERLMRRLGMAIPVRRKAQELRVGEKQTIEIAKALSLGARVLIMDEPTSALSPAECEKLFAVIKQLAAEGVAIIYISHRMEEVQRLADRVMVLRDGRHVITAPIGEMPTERIISSMVGRTIAQMEHTSQIAGDAPQLQVSHLGLTPARSGGSQRRAIHDVSFSVRKGEIFGIAGLLGSGRTEILESLFGATDGTVTGEISIAGQPVQIREPRDAKQHGLALVTEERKVTGLQLDETILGNIVLPSTERLARFAVPDRRRESDMGERLFKQLRVKASGTGQLAQELSGGNQQKVVLAKWLGTGPRILLLDEPTRGIDVGAKAEIYELIRALAADGLSIVVVSSELPELLLLCDRLLVMREGRPAGTLSREDASEEAIMRLAAPGGATNRGQAA